MHIFLEDTENQNNSKYYFAMDICEHFEIYLRVE